VFSACNLYPRPVLGVIVGVGVFVGVLVKVGVILGVGVKVGVVVGVGVLVAVGVGLGQPAIDVKLPKLLVVNIVPPKPAELDNNILDAGIVKLLSK
jgi:hypothetical protein